MTIPRLINQYLTQALQFVITWVAGMIAKAIEAGKDAIRAIKKSRVKKFITHLPG